MPLHKKDARNIFNNYRPISLLSVVGKIFERVIFKHVLNYFRDNFLISIFLSGFTPGDSTVNQLTDLYHTLCDAIDKKKEVRIVFFDKVWHKGLLIKLKRMGINGNLLRWFADYLEDRLQRVIINGNSSVWGKIKAGVPQGSVLGPLLFLVYINDITEVVSTSIRLFADDTCVYITVDKDNENVSTDLINNDLSNILKWADQWLVTFSAPKTKCMTISRKTDSQLHHLPLLFANTILSDVETHKHLGLIIDKTLTCNWSKHVDEVCVKAGTRVNILSRLKYTLDRKMLETMYLSFIRPIMEYTNSVWCNLSKNDILKIENVQLRAGRIVSGAIKGTSSKIIYEELGWQTLRKRQENNVTCFS